MARKKKSDAAPLFDVKTTTAPCVSAIRDKVDQWRAADYPGVTDTTRRLLNHWFLTDHRLPGRGKFQYHYFQRQAVETLIYLYEVARVRRQKSLIESYAHRQDLKLLQYDDYAKTFLLIAPNVIVFERLRTDFAAGRIFVLDPVIPDDLRIYWDSQCYTRGEAERASSLGALYLTNVQQLYDRPATDEDEPDVMTAMLGPKPPSQGLEVEDFLPRIIARGAPVVVLNDEAHHTHDEESEWNKSIRRLHSALTTSPERERRDGADPSLALVRGSPLSSTSPPRRGTPRVSSSPGRSTITPSSKPSSMASSSGP
ncbi:MAG: DEAD/DEAH box helicase family protein [Planctomycetes bacterium]|nr:DEAD/DEAH box helicase family protein [Planctomycetota bacterium]